MAISMIFRFGSSIADPLEKVTAAAAKICEGDLDFDFADISRNDEVGVLMHTFQRMRRSLTVLAGRARQIAEGRSWIWLEEDVIRFKAEASAWTPSAVQLQQVWVDPVARRHGYAQRALRDLCRLLLRQTPTVCLFVRPENAPALRLYDSIGMTRELTYRSLVF